MVGTKRPSGEEMFGCSAGCKAFVQFMRVDWRKPCISDHSFIVVSTKIFKVPRFRRACSQHNLTSSTPELPTQILTPCTTCEVISSSVHRNLCREERSSLLHKLRKVQLSIRTRRQCSSSLGNNRAIYTRKDKTRLSFPT